DGSGVAVLDIEFQKCKWYVHQEVWKSFIDPSTSMLLDQPTKTIAKKNVNFGSLYPGAIKRHNVFSESDVFDSPTGLLPAVFFLVGGLAVRLGNSGDGVLLVPDVHDLLDFIFDRPFMTPRTVGEVRVAGAADAAF